MKRTILAIVATLTLTATAHGQCENGQCFAPLRQRAVFAPMSRPVFRLAPRQITQAPLSQPSVQYVESLPPIVSYAPQPVYRYYYGRPVVRQGTCVNGVCR